MKATILSFLCALAIPSAAHAALPTAQLRQDIKNELINHYVGLQNTTIQLRKSGTFYATHKFLGGTVAHVKGQIDMNTGAIKSFTEKLSKK
jgi:hypothetical protein